ncbi:hypothetical protein D9611_012537 [Ephemerocybe angulata]|uniref:Uncharacterized protein n=1 Tax=Ephemerocybe angulata TaxID=980116 RepID=A0A8H5AUJ6_9AGAR|nr:hypothetical protein D9611_012537 [Tulosesus angulatus]
MLNAVNDLLARTPELYLLALAQFAIAADTEVVRHAVVLSSSPPPTALSFAAAPPRFSLYDHLSSQTLTTLELLLLRSLSREPSPSVRKKSVNTICDVAKGMGAGAGSILLADDALPPSPSSSSPLLYPSPPPSPFRTEPACWVGYTGDTREIGRRFDGPADWRLLLGSGGRRRPNHRSTSTPIQFTPTHLLPTPLFPPSSPADTSHHDEHSTQLQPHGTTHFPPLPDTTTSTDDHR